MGLLQFTSMPCLTQFCLFVFKLAWLPTFENRELSLEKSQLLVSLG